jgi:hypothetical protein
MLEGTRTCLQARGAVYGEAAKELASALARLDPNQHPLLTLDLREATGLDPSVVHGLMHAWERRGQQRGCVRVLVSPGPVQRFLDSLGLQRALDVDQERHPAPEEEALAWFADTGTRREALEGALGHYRQLLDAMRRRDLEATRTLAAEAHSVCVAMGAAPGGHAIGEWCERCPMREAYGGCQPVLAHAVRAADRGAWEAAELLVLALMAEVVGMEPPPAPTP